VRERDQPGYSLSFPVYGTETREQAEGLISTVTRVLFDGRRIYSWPDFRRGSQIVEDMGNVAATFAALERGDVDAYNQATQRATHFKEVHA
jgi:hypothetical protein